MRPSESRITRSAMSAMPTLCVISTVSVPSSRLTFSSASRTTTPVAESSAPVGSSHRSTAGFFAMARAIATRCCSPPESCAGKWSSRASRPTSLSASSGSIGDFAISVTAATFSRAVRLGIRL